MKIKELSELTNIEVTSLQELVKDRSTVYTIGVEVGDMPKEIIIQVLSQIRKHCDEAKLNTIIYPISNGKGYWKIHKLEK